MRICQIQVHIAAKIVVLPPGTLVALLFAVCLPMFRICWLLADRRAVRLQRLVFTVYMLVLNRYYRTHTAVSMHENCG